MANTDDRKDREWSRRGLFQVAGAALATGTLAAAIRPAAAASASGAIKLPRLLAHSEVEPSSTPEPLPEHKRIGVAVVGLGHLALEQILPAFGESKRCRLTALVSGDRAKATALGARYGVDPKSLYDYKSYDRLRNEGNVDLVYVVLPNGMHAEYTIRAFQAGKHVLCEKPMATSVTECRDMIQAASKAGKKLMIAYRMQYEPYNREAIRMARAGDLGTLKAFSAINGQTQGDPKQWRLKKALSGGGALPDVGIYCLNAARYLTGEEPIEISAILQSTPNDPRFTEVEEQVDFVLRFPSGFLASCSTSYGYHNSKRYRLIGESGWLELDPAFPYRGQQMRIGRTRQETDVEQVETRLLEPKNHFATEMDHMAECIQAGRQPHTPGEEGMQDMRIIAAIYDAASRAVTVKMPLVSGRDTFRGPSPG